MEEVYFKPVRAASYNQDPLVYFLVLNICFNIQIAKWKTQSYELKKTHEIDIPGQMLPRTGKNGEHVIKENSYSETHLQRFSQQIIHQPCETGKIL